MSLDTWNGILIGMLAVVIVGFVLLVVFVYILMRFIWMPHAIEDPETSTTLGIYDEDDETDEFLRDLNRQGTDG